MRPRSWSLWKEIAMTRRKKQKNRVHSRNCCSISPNAACNSRSGHCSRKSALWQRKRLGHRWEQQRSRGRRKKIPPKKASKRTPMCTMQFCPLFWSLCSSQCTNCGSWPWHAWAWCVCVMPLSVRPTEESFFKLLGEILKNQASERRRYRVSWTSPSSTDPGTTTTPTWTICCFVCRRTATRSPCWWPRRAPPSCSTQALTRNRGSSLIC
mmetsp:Transcript_23384/g.38957  ORF Transcript_23384/g.38957 Transcript_23384/m.38957 type:complete len:210 (-) Transcript_23384:1493-2122(-)